MRHRLCGIMHLYGLNACQRKMTYKMSTPPRVLYGPWYLFTITLWRCAANVVAPLLFQLFDLDLIALTHVKTAVFHIYRQR